ncbi:hypothetical protein CK203_030260 [Vitis vinifera]|uniref:Uncharacterized protein n=1 Tax=Vitis vinifera TaxID=29760 RepID=A0A438I555_VITVI|nr:hypothetical protein CK203_030260 [Vitis vinifera]
MISRTTLKPRMCDCVYLCVLELTLLASKLSLALQLEQLEELNVEKGALQALRDLEIRFCRSLKILPAELLHRTLLKIEVLPAHVDSGNEQQSRGYTQGLNSWVSIGGKALSYKISLGNSDITGNCNRMARDRGSLVVCAEKGDDESCVCGEAILFRKAGLTGSTNQVAQISRVVSTSNPSTPSPITGTIFNTDPTKNRLNLVALVEILSGLS